MFSYLLIFFNILPEVWYHIRIAPDGEDEIQFILKELNQTNDTYKKLEKIAIWEGKNIWYVYGTDPSLKIGNYEFYTSDLSLRVRVKGGQFTNDPKWIAYYKVGGCGELASLFSYVANRAGFKTRVINDPGIDHSWVEIKINDSWVVADPTIYWWYINDKRKYSNWNEVWFNNFRSVSYTHLTLPTKA